MTNPYEPQAPKKSSALPAIIGVLVALALVAGGYWWFSKDTADNPQAAGTSEPMSQTVEDKETAAPVSTTTVTELTTVTAEPDPNDPDLTRTTLPEDAINCGDGDRMTIFVASDKDCASPMYLLNEEGTLSDLVFPKYENQPIIPVTSRYDAELQLDCYQISPRLFRCVGDRGEDFYVKTRGLGF